MDRERSRGRIAQERIAAALRSWVNVAFRVFYYGYRRDLNLFFPRQSAFPICDYFHFCVQCFGEAMCELRVNNIV